ncbi:MAG: hypothetical protein ACJ76N_24115 [Thermoanaerobaculia bacterium]
MALEERLGYVRDRKLVVLKKKADVSGVWGFLERSCDDSFLVDGAGDVESSVELCQERQAVQLA